MFNVLELLHYDETRQREELDPLVHPSALSQNSIIEFLLDNSGALLPTFRTNCPDGSQFAQMGSDFAQKTITNPCSLLSRQKPLSGICTFTKMIKIKPYVVIAFCYRKANILRKWSKILHFCYGNKGLCHGCRSQ